MNGINLKLKGSMKVFDEKYNQLFTCIGDHRTMVLSTAVGDIVNSKMMSVVQFDKKFYFQTDSKMDKYSQLKIQPNVSLCFDNVSIQGKCKEVGKPFENEKFCELYEKNFACAYQLYSHLENEVLFEITPTAIKVWGYENSNPYYEIYNVQNKTYIINEYK